MEDDLCCRQVLIPAGFWSRGMAFAIDLGLLVALHCTFFLLFGHALLGLVPVNLVAILAVGTIFLLLFLLTPWLMLFFYSVVLHASGGQTVGKLIMGLRLVSADGAPVTVGVAFLRWVAVILSLLPLGAGFLWAAVSTKRVAWHDMVAGTMVVSVEQTS